MRSVHFAHSFSKLSETFIYDYVTSLQAQGVDTKVITLNHLNPDERPFESVDLVRVGWWNLERIWRIACDWLLGNDTDRSAWPVYRKKLKQLIMAAPPDVLHAHFGPMGVLLAPVARELNIPLVVTFYGYDISEILEQQYWRDAYKKLAEIADQITVLSEEMKTRALELGFEADQVKVIHVGTKVEEIEYRLPSYPVRNFISVGRLTEKKGHLDTLKAFKAVLKESHENLHLSIIGEGEDRATLESYIDTQNMEQHVSLPGNVAHSELFDHLYKADAFILNSKTSSKGNREGTPTVLIEAQAVGLPCISTFHAGIPEIIPDHNHTYLAEEGNISQIISNIEKLISAPEAEIQKNSRLGRQRVEESFNIVTEAAKIKELYYQVTH